MPKQRQMVLNWMVVGSELISPSPAEPTAPLQGSIWGGLPGFVATAGLAQGHVEDWRADTEHVIVAIFLPN